MFARTSALYAGHLLTTLSDVTAEQVEAAFGAPDEEGYVDEEAGYNGLDWCFTGPGGVTFHVYDRSGELRVGGEADPTAFVRWLRSGVASRGR